MKIVFASNNPNKVAEMKQALGEGFELLTLSDIGFEGEIPETGETLEYNAEEKARYIFDQFQIPVFADDTGLEVEALDGKPGVHTAHYSGSRDAASNMALVLSEMKSAQSRKARFRTVISFVSKERSEFFEGIVNGEVATEISGVKGFGYDPIFKPEGDSRTFAEMGMEEKAKTNHRVRALAKLKTFVKQLHK